MGYERKKMRFEILLEKYFTNFPKFLLTNLIFAVPSLLILTAFYFLSTAIFQSVDVIFMMLSIIPIYPFYAGVIKVVRNILRGDDSFGVMQTYISGVKENFLPFLLHGVIITAASAVSFLSINLYIHLLPQSWFFGFLLFFCIIIVLLMFFISLYLPLMSVTFDLPLRYVYKNSLLMSYGEFKNNLFAFFATAVFMAILMTVLVFLFGTIWFLIFFAVLWALIIPSTYAFVSSFFIYDSMYTMIVNAGLFKAEKAAKENKDKPAEKSPVIDKPDLSSVDISKLKDTDDYIYFNGKMVKQSTLLKMIRENERSGHEVDHE